MNLNKLEVSSGHPVKSCTLFNDELRTRLEIKFDNYSHPGNDTVYLFRGDVVTGILSFEMAKAFIRLMQRQEVPA